MNAVGIDADQTLGALVAERPQLARPLEHLRLDYCCGGGRTLAEACRERSLDPGTVVTMLEALADATPATPSEAHDLRGATIAELCDHIVATHHAWLRRELPRISELLATVVRVHGDDDHRLADLERRFTALEGELTAHLESEEATLFPAARALDGPDGAGAGLAGLVDVHVAEHEDAGAALAAMRELADDYRLEQALCGTHRALLAALSSLELDMHQHVHEENNILFPRLRAAVSA